MHRIHTSHFAHALVLRNLWSSRLQEQVQETLSDLWRCAEHGHADLSVVAIMTVRVLRVCVIGAGLAGLACALAAARSNLQVEVLEGSAQPLGLQAHIEVVPNMLRDLAALGVADECVRTGFAFQGVDVLDRHGRHLHLLATPALAGPGLPAALGICHDQLQRVLERAAVDSGVTVRRGAQVLSVHPHGGQARIGLAQGPSIEADLVVLAAGHSSPLRSQLFPWASPAIAMAQAWWYALMPRPLDLDRPLIAHGSPGYRAVLVPVSHGQAGVAVMAPLPAESVRHSQQMRILLSTFSPRLRRIADQLEGGVVVQRPASFALLPPPWHRDAVLAVGDSAHAFPPHIGQAAAQAVEDARVLAELLAVAPDRSTLLAAFQQRRADRVRQVYDMAIAAARWDLKPDAEADLALLTEQLSQIVARPA
jgi:2-polyprenyl-6-methoxyphenol hydroxylase-like FAD-dependent oxidoreductase